MPGKQNSVSDYTIITHTDIDGVGAAALYIYLRGTKPKEILFYEPYELDKLAKKITKLNTYYIAIMDIGMNNIVFPKVYEALKNVIEKGATIEWYDHHVWNREWINKFNSINVRIYIDRSTCATGVVAKNAPRNKRDVDEDFVNELVKGVCAGDLWKFDHWRGPWYLRLVRRRDDPKWRLKVLYTLSTGKLWTNEFTENIVEKLDRELRAYNNLLDSFTILSISGYKIVLAPAHPSIDTSFIAALALSRTNSDIAVVVADNGKLSFRSRNVDVRELAVALGGGGHPRASGAKIKIPFKVRTLSLWRKEYLLHYVAKQIEKTIYELGGLKQL